MSAKATGITAIRRRDVARIQVPANDKPYCYLKAPKEPPPPIFFVPLREAMLQMPRAATLQAARRRAPASSTRFREPGSLYCLVSFNHIILWVSLHVSCATPGCASSTPCPPKRYLPGMAVSELAAVYISVDWWTNVFVGLSVHPYSTSAAAILLLVYPCCSVVWPVLMLTC